MNTVHSLAAVKLRKIFETDLTVSHIAEFDLEYADPLASNSQLIKMMTEEDFDVMPLGGEALTRYVNRKDLTGDASVLDIARPIEIADVVSESTSIIRTLKLLTAREWFFVLRHDVVAGIVTQADLRKPPVQMFLFGLVLLFEAKLVRLISHHLPSDQWQQSLTPPRMEKARELLGLKKSTNEALGLIDCLMLCDKGAIVQKTRELLDALGLSKPEAKKLFHQIEMLRNALAHGEDFLQGLSWNDIMTLVDTMEQTLNVYDGTIIVEFSGVPSDTAIAIAQNQHTESLGELLADTLGLNEYADREILNDEIVGVLAKLIDSYQKQ